MNRYPCRCRSCDGRRTLSQLPENMRNGCKCKACREARAKGIEPIVHCDCGGTYRVDVYRLKTEHKKYGCQCSGFPFDNGTHRKGSSSPSNGWYCIHNVKGEGQ